MEVCMFKVTSSSPQLQTQNVLLMVGPSIKKIYHMEAFECTCIHLSLFIVCTFTYTVHTDRDATNKCFNYSLI